MTMTQLLKALVDSQINGNQYVMISKRTGATYFLIGLASNRSAALNTYPTIKLGVIAQKTFGQPIISDTFVVDAETVIESYDFIN